MQSMFDMFYLSMGAMSSGNISSHGVFVVDPQFLELQCIKVLNVLVLSASKLSKFHFEGLWQ